MTFETFFLGREKIKNPFVEEMISSGIEISGKGTGANGSISMRYGNRMVITTGDATLSSLTESDFVEVADYDAVRNVAMVIGLKEPSPDTPLHWLIYRREDINAIISIGNPVGKEQAGLDTALDALRRLKKSNCITLEGYGCISVGKSLREAAEGITCV